MLGSVNAGVEHYKKEVADLVACQATWPDAIGRIITERFSYDEFENALLPHSVDEIKVVVDWA